MDKSNLLADLKFLIKSPVARNDANVERLNQCANYIFEEFKKQTDQVEEQSYLVGTLEYKNIICSFGPRDAERIIVGAHYDVCDNQPGADDNASGVAGLLEIARLLKSQGGILKYRIDLVAYSLEEPPNFRTENMGSAVHAKMLHDNKVKVKKMICLEMIGYFSEKPKSQEYPIGLMKLFYPAKGNYISVVGKTGQGKTVRNTKKEMKKNSSIKVCSINAPAFIPGIDFSDHLNYWKYGYTAVMITDTSFYRNANYHEKTDTLETLDIDKMAEVIKGVFYAIVNSK
ncbi:MAG: peptidase M28 [Bacteroidetes bacterium RIFCSPLOWO2_12_FULL_35_15]|nr:MAG: peptidase M28 [Bacteroidetes bacterium RIFCSPLOWO2_12_FULL_35_15]